MYFASAALALGSGDDDIHPPATALGTDEPPTPIEHGRVRAVSSSHLDGVGRDLVAARLAPHDQPHLRVLRVAECHRRADGDFTSLAL